MPVGKFDPGQLRTLQRRVRNWRATAGPGKEVFFAQHHKPGEAHCRRARSHEATRVERLKEHREEDVLVTGWSTIRVKNNTYFVPSRLIGEWVACTCTTTSWT